MQVHQALVGPFNEAVRIAQILAACRVIFFPNDHSVGVADKLMLGAEGATLARAQPQRAKAGLDPWAYPQVYNNIDDFFRTGSTYNNSINVMQSLDKGNYSFSLGNSTAQGIVPSTGMTRTGARGAVDWQIDDQWKTGFSANYSSVKITSAPASSAAP